MTRDEEVRRRAGLGATIQAGLRRADGTGWAMITGQEGEEFRVERGEAECRAAPPRTP